MAATSALSALPFLGNLVAGGLKIGFKGSKVAAKAGKFVTEISRFTSHSAQAIMSTIDSCYAAKDYKQARAAGESGNAEMMQLGLSFAGALFSAGGAARSGKSLKNLLGGNKPAGAAISNVKHGVAPEVAEEATKCNRVKQATTSSSVAGGKGSSGQVGGVIVFPSSYTKPRGSFGYQSGTKATSGFEDWLNKGSADNKVYFGIKKGEAQYTGITKQTLDARLSQHNANGKGFQRLEEQFSGLTRNQARAIEQYYIGKPNGPNAMNKINSIGPNNKYYYDALNWAKQYLGVN